MSEFKFLCYSENRTCGEFYLSGEEEHTTFSIPIPEDKYIDELVVKRFAIQDCRKNSIVEVNGEFYLMQDFPITDMWERFYKSFLWFNSPQGRFYRESYLNSGLISEQELEKNDISKNLREKILILFLNDRLGYKIGSNVFLIRSSSPQGVGVFAIAKMTKIDSHDIISSIRDGEFGVKVPGLDNIPSSSIKDYYGLEINELKMTRPLQRIILKAFER